MKRWCEAVRRGAAARWRGTHSKAFFASSALTIAALASGCDSLTPGASSATGGAGGETGAAQSGGKPAPNPNAAGEESGDAGANPDPGTGGTQGTTPGAGRDHNESGGKSTRGAGGRDTPAIGGVDGTGAPSEGGVFGEAGEANVAGVGGVPADPTCGGSLCAEEASCLGATGAPACVCNPGFTGDGLSCVDIDECKSYAPCDALAVCVNSPGSYSCVCPLGYESDGTTCTIYEHGLIVRPTNKTCLAPALRAPDPTVLTLEPAFPALAIATPTAMVELPATIGYGWLITEIDGSLRHVSADGSAAELVVDMRPQMDQNLPAGKTSREVGIELGLLGVAVHPDFPNDARIFVTYTINRGSPQAPEWALRLSSVDWFGATITDPAAETVMLEIGTADAVHHAGTIGFDGTGALILSTGDGGPDNFDPHDNAQDTNKLLGKLLRIDVDHNDEDRALPYAIPPDNPFATGGGAPEIYALGFRNPWKWSFDRATGDLWVADVGRYDREEVDMVVAGGNYGWPAFEGTMCTGRSSCTNPDLLPPLYELDRTGAGAAIIGGYVYRGKAIPELFGTYVFGDLVRSTISGVYQNGGGWEPTLLAESHDLPISFAQDHDGELYVLTYLAGTSVLKLVRNTSRPGDPPARLSQTGCVKPGDPQAAADGMIPYEVNVPFWSDGAEKSRYLALPDGAAIDIDADGDWQLPVGTVLMKHFRRGGRLIESRLLMHHGDGWAGYSYEWNADQTDATLLGIGKTKMLDDGLYTFPSRAACLYCHNSSAGYSLGLTTAQLNRLEYYPSSQRLAPQLRTFEAVGLFAPLSAPAPALPSLDDQTQSLDLRARAYLDVNCSYCHRPNGPTPVTMDLRFGVPFEDTGTCAVLPQRDDFGLYEAARIAPGSPGSSIVSYRIHAEDAAQMPPLGRNRHDPNGAALVDAWIASLVECPPATQ